MTRKKSNTAQALLDAHVQFILDQLDGAALKALIERELDAGLAIAGKITLNAAVTRSMIKDTAQVYASELEFGAGIPELVGEVARALYAHKIHEKTKLGDVVSEKRFSETVDQLLEMKSLRGKLLHAAAENPLYAAFASDLLYHGIKGYLGENVLTRNIPGASSMMKLGKSVLGKASPGLENSIEESLKRYIGKSVQSSARRSVQFFLENADDDMLRDAAMEVWARLKPLRIGDLRADVSELVIEEMFVNAYEYWRELRRTPYYRALIDAGIDGVFDRYGDSTLLDLLKDFGITRELMLDEGMRYGPPVLKMLKKKKLLEPVIRRNLEGFYHSAAAAEILSAEEKEK